MKIKTGVSIKKLTPQMALGAVIAGQAWEAVTGKEAVITSGDDGTMHFGDGSNNSLHPVGNAIDIRINSEPEPTKRLAARKQIKDNLGNDFDVVLEKDHIHIEYQPKYFATKPIS